VNTAVLARFAIDLTGRIAMLGLTIFTARALGVSEFGRLAFALSFANLLYVLSECGTHLVFLRDLSVAESDLARQRQLWARYLGVKALLCIGAGILGALLSPWVWPWPAPSILVAVVAWMMVNSFIDFLHQACNARRDLAASAWLMALHRGLSVVPAVIVAFLWRDLAYTSFALLLGAAVALPLGLAAVARRFGLPLDARFRPGDILGVVSRSAPLALANLFGSTYTKLGLLLLPWLGYASAAGPYGAAQRLFEVSYLLPSAIVTVLLPSLAASHASDLEAFRQRARKSLATMAAAGIATVAAGVPLAGVAIGLLFGAEFEQSTPILRILLVALALVNVNYLATSLMVVVHRIPRHALHQALCLAICFVATVVGVRHWGPLAGAWAVVATELVLLVLTLFALAPCLIRRGQAPA
jgi:O-antigen/teichoic acid export membrane protein